MLSSYEEEADGKIAIHIKHATMINPEIRHTCSSDITVSRHRSSYVS